MALFSVNQNGQWFTVKGYQASTLSNVGDIKINSDNSTPAKANKIWFEYKDAIGNKDLLKRSEVINKTNHGRITVVPAAVMAWTPNGVTITFDGNVSAPINGEVYGIYINQRNYHALGDNEFMELGAEVRYNSKFNFEAEGVFDATTAYGIGDVVTYATDGKTYIFKASHSAGAWNASHVDVIPEGGLPINSVAYLMKAIAQAFVRNLGADNDLYTVTVTSSAANAGVITIMPKEQAWIQGTMQAERVSLDTQDVFLSNVIINTRERNDWATIATTTGTPVVNTKDIADMEWFYLGEHGDQQRLMGYPYANAATINRSIYKVDPTNTYGYDLVIIHHNYVGNGTFVQKSEQDIMIACPVKIESGDTAHAITDAFLGAVKGYFGLDDSYDTIAEYVDGSGNPIAKTFEF